MKPICCKSIFIILLIISIKSMNSAEQKFQLGGNCLALALINDDAELIAGKENLLVFYDASGGQQNKLLNNVSSNIRSIAVSPDKSKIAYLDYTWIITIVNTSGALIESIDMSKYLQSIGPINTIIKYSPDGSGMLFSSTGGIYEYKIATHQIRTIISSPAAQVFDVCYDSPKIAIAFVDSVQLIEYPSNNILSRFKTDGYILNVAISKSSGIIAVAGNNYKASLWAANNGNKIAEMQAGDNYPFPFPGLSFSPDESRLAGYYANHLFVWDAANGNSIREFPDYNWNSSFSPIVFTKDSKFIFASDGNGAIFKLNTENGNVDTIAAAIYNKTGSADDLKFCFSPDQKMFFAQNLGDVTAFDRISGKLLARYSGNTPNTGFAFYSNDGSKIISIDDYYLNAKIWDASSGSCLSSFPFYKKDVRMFSKSAVNGYLAVSSEDGDIEIYNTESGILVDKLNPFEPISTLKFMKDGKRLIIHGLSNVIIRDVNQRKNIKNISLDSIAEYIDIHPDDNIMLVNFVNDSLFLNDTPLKFKNHITYLYDLNTNNRIKDLNDSTIKEAIFNHKGDRIAELGINGNIRIVKYPEGDTVAIISPGGACNEFAFTTDDKKIVINTDLGYNTKFFDSEKGNYLDGMYIFSYYSISLDSKHIAYIGQYSRDVIVYDIDTNNRLKYLDPPVKTKPDFFYWSSDGSKFLTVRAQTIDIFDAITCALLYSKTLSTKILSIDFNYDFSTIAAGCAVENNPVIRCYVWHPVKDEGYNLNLTDILLPTDVKSVKISNDGNRLALNGSLFFCVWDLELKKKISLNTIFGEIYANVYWSYDDSQIIGYNSDKIFFINPSDLKTTDTIKTLSRIIQLVANPVKSQLAYYCKDSSYFSISDYSKKPYKNKFFVFQEFPVFENLQYSANGERLVLRTFLVANLIDIYDTETWQNLHSSGHIAEDISVNCINSDAKRLAIFGEDGRICIWNTEINRLKKSFNQPLGAYFSDNIKTPYIFSYNSFSNRLSEYDAYTGILMNHYGGIINGGEGSRLIISPDGKKMFETNDLWQFSYPALIDINTGSHTYFPDRSYKPLCF
ncbi:MAG: hypothetical protein QG635_2088, partial [Bacteroidota bacterium]|nr:hypothetical protein [Bacteroidota bacterium]